MATVVLVHGALIGSWGWQRVARLVRAAGHDVYTPSLTGLGERVHLAHAGIDLRAHITDVANTLFYDDLTDVILVGWSYGTMVITGVAGQVPERVRQLIYLDGIVPREGQSFYEADGWSEEERAEDRAKGEAAGMPGFEPPSSAKQMRQRFSALSEIEAAWVAARMTPHPLATLTQPLGILRPEMASLSRAFVLCTADKTWEDIPFYRVIDQVKADPTWRYREVVTSHLGVWTDPEAVAETLVELIDNVPSPDSPA